MLSIQFLQILPGPTISSFVSEQEEDTFKKFQREVQIKRDNLAQKMRFQREKRIARDEAYRLQDLKRDEERKSLRLKFRQEMQFLEEQIKQDQFEALKREEEMKVYREKYRACRFKASKCELEYQLRRDERSQSKRALIKEQDVMIQNLKIQRSKIKPEKLKADLESDQKRMGKWLFRKTVNVFRESIEREDHIDDPCFGTYKIISVFDTLDLDKSKDHAPVSKLIIEDECGQTSHLHNTGYVQALCNSEFTINAVRTSPLKWSMLHHKKLDIAEALLKSGADPNRLDQDNKTILDHVVAYHHDDMQQRMNLLQRYGANPASPDTIDQLKNRHKASKSKK